MTQSSPLRLTPEIVALVGDALESGNIMLLGVVSEDNKPLLSFRGSLVVFGETQFSFWARNVGGSTLTAIAQNPAVAIMYRSKTVPMLQFCGRARITNNASERDRAFELSSVREQEHDPERKGCAVIVELDTINGVLGFNDKGPIFCNMAR